MSNVYRSNKKSGGITPTGTKQITINAAGTTTHDVAAYANAEVTTSGLVKPTGTKTITENGTGIDVANYEFVDVNVSGGGSLDETTLWTNPNPTSDFSGQTVTLSDDIDNYDYIKIEFDGSNVATWDTTPNVSVIFSVSEFKTTANSNKHIRCAAAAQGSTNYARLFNYATNTTLQFGNSVSITNGSLVNSANIPIKISGLKLGGGNMPELDIANRVEITTSPITTSKNGAIIGSFYISGTTGSYLRIDNEDFKYFAAQTIFQLDEQFIPAGSTIAFTIAPTSTGYKVYFVPYKN